MERFPGTETCQGIPAIESDLKALCWSLELRAFRCCPEDERNENLFVRLFGREFDIEHIQSYADEKDSDAVWTEWSSEINKIGNLAMFERDKNRGVQNHSEKKAMAYANSQYRSLSCLKDRVAHWSKDDAKNRGKTICEELKKFLFTEGI